MRWESWDIFEPGRERLLFAYKGFSLASLEGEHTAGDRGSRRELKEVIGEVVWVNSNGGLDHSTDE